jgi:carotenoid cleavage dioxygenase-like enzyme
MNTGKIAHYDFIRYKVDQNVSADPASKNACEHAELIASVPSTRESGLSYFHSFGVTKNYIVFMEQAVTINFKQMLMAVIKNKPATAGIITEPNLPTRIHIIDKRTGKVIDKKFTTDPQFTFHYINAYENVNASTNKTEIILDVSSYDAQHFDINNFTFDNMYTGKLIESKMLEALAKRITIPIDSPEHDVKCETKILNKGSF